ncbi:predicted protein [Sclerotinia sclerotiorum 1980 UF-70]|uniref:Uncharacterized protein n=2 Tax=Sclerotinia sclerotiorum (strain ATCC 18683 / 1980 / Ss-1) TaxID=665079 RepID=A7F7B0_SCLS1|nr:predicted protein [Sclerotinia sclerotiorum 1980 UF-70]APA15538.1 hypothetical protein sscle_15g103080 [Sclerotinia sclerotiorum 1980 UF-70]EDN98631.1 predicted protein [Sclerotinia sclerotiorum 1980 UF-70]
MPHHLTSLFKSAAGIANGVLGNSVGSRRRNGNGNEKQDLLKREKGENEREEKLRTEDLGLGGVARDEGGIVGGDLVEGDDGVEGREMSGMSGRSGTCKHCKSIVTSGSTATDRKDNLLPLTPCLRAVDGSDVEVSPTDELGGFGGEGGSGSVDEEDEGGGIKNTGASGLETGGKSHKDKDITPTSIPLPISSTTSSINTISEIQYTATRNRSSTIPRKQIVTNIRGCLEWKTEYGGYEGMECGGKGEGRGNVERGERLRSFGSAKSKAIGERKEERNARLERERMERSRRDLRHENPLYSHPVQPNTISQGTPPTTNPLYANTSSPSINSSNSKSRAFRHSYTVPIHGLNLMGKGVEGSTDVEGISGGMENICTGNSVSGVSGMGRGTARDRYSGNSNTSVSGSGSGAMGMGSRRGSFLRRASVSFKGLGAGMGFMRSSSGGGIAVGGTGEGMQVLGVNSEKVDSNTIPAEFLRGVGGYAGDGMGICVGREKSEMDTEKRHSYRHSLILPKFEWEEESVGGKEV